MILVFTWFTVVVLNASYEIKSCLLLNNSTFSCCLHVFLNNFLVPRVEVNRGVLRGPYFWCWIDVTWCNVFLMAPLTRWWPKSESESESCQIFNLLVRCYINQSSCQLPLESVATVIPTQALLSWSFNKNIYFVSYYEASRGR